MICHDERSRPKHPGNSFGFVDRLTGICLMYPPYQQPPQRPNEPMVNWKMLGVFAAAGLAIAVFGTIMAIGAKQRDTLRPLPSGMASATAAQPIPVPSLQFHDDRERTAGVSRSMPTKYVVVEAKNFDFRDINQPDAPLIHRVRWKIVVPHGIPHGELEANVRHALLMASESTDPLPHAVNVLAYASKGADAAATPVTGAFDAASGTFAPHGRWDDTDTSAWLSSWQVKVEFAGSY